MLWCGAVDTNDKLQQIDVAKKMQQIGVAIIASVPLLCGPERREDFACGNNVFFFLQQYEIAMQ